MRKALLVAAISASLLFLIGCSPRPVPEVVADSDAVKDIMLKHIEPAAQIYWRSAGSIDTATGSISLVPDTPAEWGAAEKSVDGIIEGAKMLTARGVARDRGDWIKHTKNLIVQAEAARAAVKAQDGDRMFDTGGTLYAACTDCHKQYLLPFIGADGRPLKIDENGSPIATPAK